VRGADSRSSIRLPPTGGDQPRGPCCVGHGSPCAWASRRTSEPAAGELAGSQGHTVPSLLARLAESPSPHPQPCKQCEDRGLLPCQRRSDSRRRSRSGICGATTPRGATPEQTPRLRAAPLYIIRDLHYRRSALLPPGTYVGFDGTVSSRSAKAQKGHRRALICSYDWWAAGTFCRRAS